MVKHAKGVGGVFTVYVHVLSLSIVKVNAVAREPAGEWANNGVGQGLRLAIGLRGAVISYCWV